MTEREFTFAKLIQLLLSGLHSGKADKLWLKKIKRITESSRKLIRN